MSDLETYEVVDTQISVAEEGIHDLMLIVMESVFEHKEVTVKARLSKPEYNEGVVEAFIRKPEQNESVDTEAIYTARRYLLDNKFSVTIEA